MIYFQMLLGHLVGDYLLQNEWMALNKAKYTWIGWLSAFVHCVLYTLAVCLIMSNFQPLWIIVVFLSHFPIDKFGLAELYMHYIKGYGLKRFINDINHPTQWQYINNSPGNQMLKGGFTAYIYAVTDNTLHLVLMYLAYQIIY
jgi:hypothetical protein